MGRSGRRQTPHGSISVGRAPVVRSADDLPQPTAGSGVREGCRAPLGRLQRCLLHVPRARAQRRARQERPRLLLRRRGRPRVAEGRPSARHRRCRRARRTMGHRRRTSPDSSHEEESVRVGAHDRRDSRPDSRPDSSRPRRDVRRHPPRGARAARPACFDRGARRAHGARDQQPAHGGDLQPRACDRTARREKESRVGGASARCNGRCEARVIRRGDNASVGVERELGILVRPRGPSENHHGSEARARRG